MDSIMQEAQPFQEIDMNSQEISGGDYKIKKLQSATCSNNTLDSTTVLSSFQNQSQNSHVESQKHETSKNPYDRKLNKLEEQLNQYLFFNPEMKHITKFFLVPIGLPGMGKTTLSRYLGQHQSRHQQTQFPKIQNFQKRASHEAKIEFQKISYDRILTSNQMEYCEQHPEVGMHEAIDIIRGKADQDYLDAITYQCDAPNESYGQKQIVYLDRNNTPDVWADIQNTIVKANKNKKVKDYKTVLIVPEQHQDFQPSLYHTQNPICPQMIYECIKRIFGREDHSCLSSACKPKVVEVILKFAKLYDGVDLSNDEILRSYFDDFVRLDFLQFADRPNLQAECIETLIDGYNQTPPNFQCPSDEIIEEVIKAVERQIETDQKMEANGPQ